MGLVEILAQLQASYEADVKAAYDDGFAKGVASTGSEKIYSQAELDVKIQEVVSPLKSEIEALQLQVSQIDQRIADAITAFKADLLIKIKEVDATEDAQLEALLK